MQEWTEAMAEDMTRDDWVACARLVDDWAELKNMGPEEVRRYCGQRGGKNASMRRRV